MGVAVSVIASPTVAWQTAPVQSVGCVASVAAIVPALVPPIAAVRVTVKFAVSVWATVRRPTAITHGLVVPVQSPPRVVVQPVKVFEPIGVAVSVTMSPTLALQLVVVQVPVPTSPMATVPPPAAAAVIGGSPTASCDSEPLDAVDGAPVDALAPTEAAAIASATMAHPASVLLLSDRPTPLRMNDRALPS